MSEWTPASFLVLSSLLYPMVSRLYNRHHSGHAGEAETSGHEGICSPQYYLAQPYGPETVNTFPSWCKDLRDRRYFTVPYQSQQVRAQGPGTVLRFLTSFTLPCYLPR